MPPICQFYGICTQEMHRFNWISFKISIAPSSLIKIRQFLLRQSEFKWPSSLSYGVSSDQNTKNTKNTKKTFKSLQTYFTLTTFVTNRDQQGIVYLIFCRYFSLQARQPLGFEDKVRFEVEVNICREGGPLPDCFTKPKSIVTAALNKVNEVNIVYCLDLLRICESLTLILIISEKKNSWQTAFYCLLMFTNRPW